MLDDECPGTATLEALLLGRLDENQADPLEEHLLACPRCATKARTVVSQDTLVDAMRKYRPRPAEDLEAVGRIVERLRSVAESSASASAVEIESAQSSVERAAGEAGLFGRLAQVVAQERKEPSSDNPDAALYDFLEPAQSVDELGRLGPYRVLRIIGAGGMGVVFMAEDTTLKRKVALKVMHPALAASSGARERFMREAQATAAIEHDHIVTIYQVDKDRGIPYIAMSLLHGETLDEQLDRSPKQSVAETLRVGREIAAGLAAAQEQGLIHRDIKPANIWLEEGTGRVKILDFGLARSADADSQLTQVGAIVGTPQYMSPEQAAKTAVDHRSDLFSLGCVLYRMATGCAPFVGSNHAAVLDAVVNDQPPTPAKLRRQLPTKLSELIMQLLSKRREERPATAAAVVETIERIESSLQQLEPTKNHPVPAPQHVTAAKSASAPPRRIPPVALVALAFAILVPLSYCAYTVIVSLTHGQLVIEADDQEVEVTVRHSDGEPIVEIVDPETNRRIYLKPGEYQLDVTVRDGEDETTFTTDRLTLKRGETEILNVRRELARRNDAPAPPQPAIAETTPPTRAGIDEPQPLAQWLEGREIITVAQDGRGDHYSIQAALTALKPGQVVKVLDKGPYWETITAVELDDNGLFSEVGTRIEVPEWIDGRGRNHDRGIVLACTSGLRIAGIEMAWPEPSSGAHGISAVNISAAGTVVLQDCHFQPNNSHDPLSQCFGLSPKNYTGLVLSTPGEETTRWFVQGNVIDGGISFSGPGSPEVSLDRNWIFGGSFGAVLTPERAKKILLRNNILHGTFGIWLRTHQMRGGDTRCRITNNLVDGYENAVLIRQLASSVRNDSTIGLTDVRVQNNILSVRREDVVERFKNDDRDHSDWKTWSFGANLYLHRLDDSQGKLTTRINQNVVNPFLTLTTTDPACLRIDPAHPAARITEGSRVANYVGAVPPGAAPREGDWFTRLLAKVPNAGQLVTNPSAREPQPLAEWLEARKVITVAQDGSGDHRTIQAAMRALKPGQVVEVMDFGPYRERLDFNDAPEDIGLVSRVGTRVELPEWKKWGPGREDPQKSIYQGWLLMLKDGFRLSGFNFVCPEIPADAEGAVAVDLGVAGDITIENCRIRQTPRQSQEMPPEPLPRQDFYAVGIGPLDWDATTAMTCFIAGNDFEGTLDLKNAPGPFLIQHNRFLNWPWAGLLLPWQTGRDVTVRHNVFECFNGIAIRSHTAAESPSYSIVNNTFHVIHTPIWGWGPTAEAKNLPPGVQIENNVLHSALDAGILVHRDDMSTAKSSWVVQHNCYPREPVARDDEWQLLTELDSRAMAADTFASSDPSDASMFLRMAKNGNAASGGVGRALPTYLGAFPPGRAHDEGDWFTRLLFAGDERQRFTGHNRWVHGAALSPAGDLAVTAGLDETVRLWDTATGEQLHQFAGHTEIVWSVAFSPNGKYVASAGGGKGSLGLWASGTDNDIRLWDVESRREIRKLTGHTDLVYCVRFSPDGARLLSAGGITDPTVRLWDVETGTQLHKLEGHTRWVTDVAFSPDGQRAASSGDDKTIRVWNLETGEQVTLIEGNETSVSGVRFHPQREQVITSSRDGALRVWELPKGKEILRLTGHQGIVNGIELSSRGRFVLSYGNDGTIRLWDLEQRRQVTRINGHGSAVWCAVLSKDSQQILSCGADLTARLWQLPDSLAE